MTNASIHSNPLYDEHTPPDSISKKSGTVKPRKKLWKTPTLRRRPTLIATDIGADIPADIGEAEPDLPKSKINALEYISRLRKRTGKATSSDANIIDRAQQTRSSLTPSTSVVELVSDPPPTSSIPFPNASPPHPIAPNNIAAEIIEEPAKPSPTVWSPAEFAQKVQQLIYGASPAVTDTSLSAADNLQTPSSRYDAGLVESLGGLDKMNEGASGSKPSVWSALDNLILPRRRRADTMRSQRQSLISDGSSIMLYAPLIVEQDPEVEVARSAVRSMSFDDIYGSGDVTPTGVSGTTNQEPLGRNENLEEPPDSNRTTRTVNVWIPSMTKISVQTMWWGYRIYLPPPVLTVLNNTQLEAAKRAAMITTALKWLITNLPTAAMPPQFRPISLLLTGLVPVVGYVGGFMAWSWSAIRSFDKGHGVILSATWLLPIALVPGTWYEDPEIEAS